MTNHSIYRVNQQSNVNSYNYKKKCLRKLTFGAWKTEYQWIIDYNNNNRKWLHLQMKNTVQRMREFFSRVYTLPECSSMKNCNCCQFSLTSAFKSSNTSGFYGLEFLAETRLGEGKWEIQRQNYKKEAQKY